MKKGTHYQQLKQRWTTHHKKLQENLWRKHKESLDWVSRNTKQLAVGSMAGLMLLNPLSIALPQPHSLVVKTKEVKDIGKSAFLIADLHQVLPSEMRPLTTEEEQKVSEIFSRYFNFKAVPQLQGKRLNRCYGLIGKEQHLARFPGDDINIHFDTRDQASKFSQEGMAPGLGAWRYFIQSDEKELSSLDKQREKYYIAVQTFLAPGFNENTKEMMDFFKYQKMLLVNPNNGKAIVCDIADSGPGESTGKHLGGSPEAMEYLEREDGTKRGAVLYFFIDDPSDKISLGPIEL